MSGSSSHRRRKPFALTHDRKRLALGFDRTLRDFAARRGDVASPARHARLLADPGAAAIVVLAVAVATDHTKRVPVGVHSDDRVQPIGLAGAAEVFDRSTGAKLRRHRAMVTNPRHAGRDATRRYTRNVGKLLDSVPFSGIIRIRDMMYSVKNPFRLDQGDVSFDAPADGEARDARAPSTRTTATTCRRPECPACSTARREAAAHVTGSPSRSRDDLMVTTGGIHGLFLVFQALLEPGDEVIVPDPEWPPCMGNIKAARGIPVPCRAARGSSAGATTCGTRIEDHAAKTRAIYINSPHNPTGGVLTREDVEAIAGSCRERGAVAGGRRSLRGRPLRRRRTRECRVAAGHVRADDFGLHLQQVVRDDRAPPRLHRLQRLRSCASG